MTLAEFVSNNSFENIIFIDDELSLIEDNSFVSNLLEKRNDFGQMILDCYNQEDLDGLLMGDLRNSYPDCFNQIIDSLNLKKMLETIESIKETGIQVSIRDNYYDDIDSSKNTIWIVDNILDNQDANKKMHIKSAFKKFSDNRRCGKNDLFIIYSNDINHFENYSKTKEFIKKYDIFELGDDVNALYFNVVNKNNVLDVTLLCNVFEKAVHADYFVRIKKVIDNSLEKIQSSLWTSEEVKTQIYYNYNVEGITNDKNFYGIILNSIDKEYHLSKVDNDFLTVIKRLDQITDYNENKEETHLMKIKGRILHDLGIIVNCEEIDCFVNSLGYDVSFGDIFEIGGLPYLVVSQQCDISIRDNGERSIDFFTLIPIELNVLSHEKIVEILLKDIKKKENIDSTMMAIICDFLILMNAQKVLGVEITNEKIKSIVQSVTDSSAKTITWPIIIKKKTSFFSVDIAKHKKQLIVDDYILDVVSHNGENGLVIDENSKPINVRFRSKKCIEESFKKASGIMQEFRDEFKDFYLTKYGVSNNEWKRIGNISFDTANLLYKKYIEHQTRHAVLIFEKV